MGIVVADYKKSRIEFACQILTSPDPTHCTARSPLLLGLNPLLLRLEGTGGFETWRGHRRVTANNVGLCATACTSEGRILPNFT